MKGNKDMAVKGNKEMMGTKAVSFQNLFFTLKKGGSENVIWKYQYRSE